MYLARAAARALGATGAFWCLAIALHGCGSETFDHAPQDRQDAGSPVTEGYWMGVAGPLARAPGSEFPVAVSCHNCYREEATETPERNLALTVEWIRLAIIAGADIIELDVKDQAGVWRVDHEDDGSAHGAPLFDLLHEETLCAASQVLFLEVKEQDATFESMHALLTLLRDSGCFEGTRLLVIRGFRGRAAALADARMALLDPQFSDLAENVRFHWLYSARALADGQWGDDVETSALAMVDGVEFEYVAPEIDALLSEARDLGLGTGLWTFPADQTESLCQTYGRATDVVTVDGTPASCKRGVER